MTRIFISYSRADEQFITTLIPLLHKVYPNHEVWWDEHITGGEDWWQRIIGEIFACNIFIYLLSNDSVGSEYCQAEFREALRLQKLCLPVIIRPKTVIDNLPTAPFDLRAEVHRLNWVDMSHGFADHRANASLYAAINGLAGKIPISPPLPIASTPTPQPTVTGTTKTTPTLATASRNRGLLVILGALISIVAILSIVPSLLNLMTSPTKAPTQSAFLSSDIPTTEVLDNTPTNTEITSTATTTFTTTPKPTETIDFASAAQTFDALGTFKANASMLTATYLFVLDQTQTATSWTRTATSTITETPHITASFQMFLTERAKTHIAQDAFDATLTATYWTATLTSTVTASSTLTFTPTTTYTPTPSIMPSEIPTLVLSTTTPTQSVTLLPTGATPTWNPTEREFDGVVMVLVPAGCSTDLSICIEKPFWFDKFEVTNGQFRRLGGKAGRASVWIQDNLPRELIKWPEAYAFCKQRNASLPTYIQWKYAAAGPQSLTYPWGNEYKKGNAITNENSGAQTAPVGSNAGDISWVGAYDLSGNVAEFISDWYDLHAEKIVPNQDSIGPVMDNYWLLLMGGSWDSAASLKGSVVTNSPEYKHSYGGFRCARPVDD